MVNDNLQHSGQVAESMFSANTGTSKNKMPYGMDENDFDMSSYYGQGSSTGVAERLGQSQLPSAFYNQKTGVGGGGLGSRGLGSQQAFSRSISMSSGLINAGHVTPTSNDNTSQTNPSRGILPLNRSAMGTTQMGVNQINSGVLGSRPSLPSPTRGISPKDMFGLKQAGNRSLNAAISRNHSFPSQLNQKPFEVQEAGAAKDRTKLWGSLFSTSVCQHQAFDYRFLANAKQDYLMPVQNTQSMPMNAIGSESISQLRHQQSFSSSSPASSNMAISTLGSFNLDQSEFPALAQQHERARPIGSQPSSSTTSKPPYGRNSPSHFERRTRDLLGMVSKQNENAEFHIHNEDFPALPGSAAMNVMKAVFPDQDGRGDESNSKFNPLGSLQLGGQVTVDKPAQKPSSSNQQKGIQVLSDNTIKNIPNSMLVDQYGIIGLFAFIKAAETDPSLVHLALGNDLTTLGLNLNSPDNLYHKFQSPFSRQPCRLQDIDYFVPSEYLTNAHIRDKLAPIKLNRYGEDLLFFVYYSNPGDVLQLAAAAELYNRDWRFHKEERIWITRMPQVEPRMKTSTYEQGTYYYFDCQSWRKAAKEFYLEYEKLEDRPHLPNLVSLHFNPAQHG